MISSRHGAAVGAFATAGYLLVRFGLLPADPFIWGVFVTLIACGAFFGAGVVLAWQHIIRKPRILIPTIAVLVILSLAPAACYQQAAHEAPSFRANADSVRGVVTGRNVFGELLVEYPRDSSRLGRLVARKKHAHHRFTPGDSIWVYRERVAPHRIDVWPPGPDLRVAARRLVWLWGIGGVLLAGYGPLFRREAATPGGTIPSPDGEHGGVAT